MRFRPLFTGVCSFPRKASFFNSVLIGLGLCAGFGWGNSFTNQMEFASMEQLPLDLLPGFQPNGRGQGNGKIDVKFRGLALGPNGLHF